MNITEKMTDATNRTSPMNQNPPRHPRDVPTITPVAMGPMACPISITVLRNPMADPEDDSVHRSETRATVDEGTDE
jgi:hypothetical protein